MGRGDARLVGVRAVGRSRADGAAVAASYPPYALRIKLISECPAKSCGASTPQVRSPIPAERSKIRKRAELLDSGGSGRPCGSSDRSRQSLFNQLHRWTLTLPVHPRVDSAVLDAAGVTWCDCLIETDLRGSTGRRASSLRRLTLGSRGPDAPRRMSSTDPPPRSLGTIVNDRYEIRRCPGKAVDPSYGARDRVEQQDVVLQWPGDAMRPPVDDAWVRRELARMQKVRHPNVRRLHGVEPTPWGLMLVVDDIVGARSTLHGAIRRQRMAGAINPTMFRVIATQVRDGLAAIHAAGTVHGELMPRNIWLAGYRVVLVGHESIEGGTPYYFSPERQRGGGPSREDDLYALGLCLLEIWTARVPEPGDRPRSRPLGEQAQFAMWAALRVDEVRQVFRLLDEDPQRRPAAHEVTFLGPNDDASSRPFTVTALLAGEPLRVALDDDGAFADWAGAPMQVALLELRGVDGEPVEQPALLETLVRRTVMSMGVAGWTGPHQIAVSLVGATVDEARRLLEHVLPYEEGLVPDGLALAATVVTHTPGRPGRGLLE